MLDCLDMISLAQVFDGRMQIACVAQDESVACHDPVHSGPEEAVESLGGRIDNRLIFVEARVEEHRNAREFFELLNQPAIKWVLVLAYRLQTAAAGDVGDGRY